MNAYMHVTVIMTAYALTCRVYIYIYTYIYAHICKYKHIYSYILNHIHGTFVSLWMCIRHACIPALLYVCVCVHEYVCCVLCCRVVCVLVAVFSLLGLGQGALINILQALSMLDAELREWDAG